jgi:hypothetical protein
MSESARISRILTNVRQCEIRASIQNARAIVSRIPCTECKNPVQAIPAVETPIESIALNSKVANCYSGVIGFQPSTESKRILDLQQKVIDQSTNPFDPTIRFVQYRGIVLPPACPPTSSALINASLPKASTKSCGLGNKFYLPTLPI